jgi:acyl carrier protein
MTKTQFIELIAAAAEVPADVLKGDARLDEIAVWDSMAVIAFVAAVDEKLGVQLEAERLAVCQTVADLVALVAEHVEN